MAMVPTLVSALCGLLVLAQTINEEFLAVWFGAAGFNLVVLLLGGLLNVFVGLIPTVLVILLGIVVLSRTTKMPLAVFEGYLVNLSATVCLGFLGIAWGLSGL